MKYAKRFLVFFLIAAAILGFAGYRYYTGRTYFNTSYVNGNTAGNLYNNGLFCEHDGTIYFSNPDDNYHLYSMDITGGNVKKLQNDIVSYINADDHYVYYVRNNISKSGDLSFLHLNANSLCRYDLKTKKVLVLDPEPSIYASLIGNYIYYIHYDTATASSLYRIKIDGSEKEQINKSPLFTCSANGQYFYYNGLDSDHNIYQMDTSTNSSNLICEGNYWMPSADNDNIYFLDCDQNYTLVRLNRSQEKPVSVTSDRIECYNIYGETIYFQRNNLDDDAALCSIKTDGSDYQVIQQGNYTNLNVTAGYVYFTAVDNQQTMFRFPVNDPAAVSIFHP